MNPNSLRQQLLENTSPRLQTLLAREALYDAESGILIIDLSRFHPTLKPVTIPHWDEMLTAQHPPLEWPAWPLLHWPAHPPILQWKQPIPQWVQETIQRFPKRHHLRLLYLCAKYPQMLELLEKMPLLAWRIVDSNMDESTLKHLFKQARTQLTHAVNWPAQKKAVCFLQKLRLRSMDQTIIQQVEQCLKQPEIMTQACQLPRINSMALTLAAQFPQLINTPLHHSLARQPCRPEQCKQLHATLSDALQLAQWLNKPLSLIEKCRFEIEIEQIYQKWLPEGLKLWQKEMHQKTETEKKEGTPCPSHWYRLNKEGIPNACHLTQHAWFIEHTQGYTLFQHTQTPLVVAIHTEQEQIIARQAENKLPTAEQQAESALLQAYLNTKT